MAVLALSCLALSLGATQHDYTQTVSGTGTILLGTGRYVKVNTWTSGSACATMKVQYTEVNGTTIFESDNLSAASISATTPYYFKSHGTPDRTFSMAYTVTSVGTCSLAFNARVKRPEDLHCINDADLLQEMQGGGHIPGQSDEGFPRHHQRLYSRETTTVPSNSSSSSLVAEDADTSIVYFGLGIGPMLEMSCLHAFTTPSQYYAAGVNDVCRAQMTGTDAVHASVQHNVYIKEGYDCNAFTDATRGNTLAVGLFGNDETERAVYGTCCSMTNASTCNSVWTLVSGTNTRACFWVEAEGTCYPEYSSTLVDMQGLVGLNDTLNIASSEVHKPKSTYVTDPDLLADAYQGVTARRWWLVVQNTVAVAAPLECGTTVTVSYISTTTGGQCEPSSRNLCDNTMATCMALPTVETTTPVYWEAAIPAADAIRNDKFHTCNCLKQKEVCYRKGGCISTKKYQLILQNCLDQGCGDYCNSGAGLVASLAMTIFAVLAVML
eukprot:TRINITY_DN1911_c0_g4_i1.p1 TRINITY_DN1911_c0_g4~~TRINITY_DN1911_c0_g4_i1.p1  ORF type:complete len:508 (+),score=144.75 TRINITY_DN1911_c0_g4_i1:40-1524(+)